MDIKFKPIYAENFDLKDIYNVNVQKVARKVGTEITKDFRKPTRTWEQKPTIRQEKIFSETAMDLTVYVDETNEAGLHYLWLDNGVPEHRIDLTGDKKIRVFPGTFTSKTVPGTLTSRKGQRADLVFTRDKEMTAHTEARNWTEAMRKHWEISFYYEMNKMFEQIARQFNK